MSKLPKKYNSDDSKKKWKISRNDYDYIALQYQKRHVSRVIHTKKILPRSVQ